MTPTTSTHRSQFGTVIGIHSSLLEIVGLPTIGPSDWVVFENKDLGQVVSFSAEKAVVMTFGHQPVAIGSHVYPKAEEPHIRVSSELLGQCITPLGEVIELAPSSSQKTSLNLPAKTLPLDPPPALLSARSLTSNSFTTGVGIVDLLVPLAAGQRELVTGDQKTGKTSFLYQAAAHQAKHGTIVIWATIGKRLSETKQLIDYLTAQNIESQTVVVMSSPQDPSGLIYLTPFTAMTIAEYFRDQGYNTLVILDDLTTHAKFYREIALLGKRFPGRDSYPGDVFYTHAHLLERAGSFTNLQDPQKTVSITCLPVAETTENELTGYIVSNLISITDGHLLFDSSLFAQGRRPALNTNLSVTRVGKQAQTRLQRSASQEVLSFLTQYQKLLSLTHFGAELSSESQVEIRRGEALLELLNQTSQSLVELPVLLLMIGGLWLNWWPTQTPLEIKAAHDCLQAHWSKTQAGEFETVLKTNNFAEFLTALPTYQKKVMATCQK